MTPLSFWCLSLSLIANVFGMREDVDGTQSRVAVDPYVDYEVGTVELATSAPTKSLFYNGTLTAEVPRSAEDEARFWGPNAQAGIFPGWTGSPPLPPTIWHGYIGPENPADCNFGYNRAIHVCCRGNLVPRCGGTFESACCGSRCFNPAVQTCCGGEVIGKCGTNSLCCGKLCYNPEFQMCCNGMVVGKCGIVSMCCNHVCINPDHQMCCYGTLNGKCGSAFSACCGNLCYDRRLFKCCSDARILVQCNNGYWPGSSNNPFQPFGGDLGGFGGPIGAFPGAAGPLIQPGPSQLVGPIGATGPLIQPAPIQSSLAQALAQGVFGGAPNIGGGGFAPHPFFGRNPDGTDLGTGQNNGQDPQTPGSIDPNELPNGGAFGANTAPDELSGPSSEWAQRSSELGDVSRNASLLSVESDDRNGNFSESLSLEDNSRF